MTKYEGCWRSSEQVKKVRLKALDPLVEIHGIFAVKTENGNCVSDEEANRLFIPYTALEKFGMVNQAICMYLQAAGKCPARDLHID